MKDEIHRKGQIVRLVVDAIVRRPNLTSFLLAFKIIVDQRIRSQPYHGQQQHAHDRSHQIKFFAEAAARRDEKKVTQAESDESEPPNRRQLQVRTSGKQHDADDAAGNIYGVGLHAIGPKIQRPPKLLPRPNHRHRYTNEKESAQDFDRNRITKDVRRMRSHAKEYHLRRRTTSLPLPKQSPLDFTT